MPPGMVETLPNGARRQRYFHDFFNYAGLHRSVWLYATPPTHIADVTVVTDIDDGTGVVRCSTVVDGQHEGSIEVELRDATGARVAGASGEDAELRVPQPQLWRPGRGYLYDLEVDLVEDGRVVDRYTLPGRASGPYGSTAHGSSSTASRSTSEASACTRT